MDKKYDFTKTEQDIYQGWQKQELFNPDKLKVKKSAKPFTVMLPPPNITGSLHIGHALNATTIDISVRQKRMAGYKALWLPGIDHAGIATQNVVEKALAKKGNTRQKIGKEAFLKEVWAWKEKYGEEILNQLKRLGASCDWSRTRFTLDEDYQASVKQAFLEFKEKGYIYQGTRVINYCIRCATSLADLELEYVDKKSKLWYFKYPLKGEKDKYITVATTRPETMLGDMAVAVHPSDKKYKELVGKTVILPLVDREIPIVADKDIDPEFGTGAVKVTPASDLTDELIAERNNLEKIKIINKKGLMTNKVPKQYQGLTRKQAGQAVIKDLEEAGLLEKTETIDNRIATCYRCHEAIEPLLSKQWFMKMSKLKEPAIKAVKDGKVKFYPERYNKIYLDWMDNVRDWCISRQIWWGHEIPIKGETDVLDTWFSSALWPYATLGWPEQTKDLKEFYPNQLLVTAKDILYLWVARMIFSGLDLAKDKPFDQVLIHATVKNKEGQRMSKSLGTGIDPLELIEEFGADATRFSLAWNSGYNQEIRYSEDDVLAGMKFNTKLWNATRFILMNADKKYSFATDIKDIKTVNKAQEKTKTELEGLIKSVTKDINRYRYDLAIQAIYHFFWHSFCDKCIEENKEAIFGNDQAKKKQTVEFLTGIIAVSLKLLHPFTPHITEKLWQELNKAFDQKAEPLIISSWPK